MSSSPPCYTAVDSVSHRCRRPLPKPSSCPRLSLWNDTSDSLSVPTSLVSETHPSLIPTPFYVDDSGGDLDPVPLIHNLPDALKNFDASFVRIKDRMKSYHSAYLEVEKAKDNLASSYEVSVSPAIA